MNDEILRFFPGLCAAGFGSPRTSKSGLRPLEHKKEAQQGDPSTLTVIFLTQAA
jgi:hypothetical protein